MRPLGNKQWRTVSKRGAAAGAVLRGCGLSNMGLRLRVEENQANGSDGPIKGGFVILDAGRNTHSDALLPLLGRLTDAREVLSVIRRSRPGCVSVANLNILTQEGPPDGPGT